MRKIRVTTPALEKMWAQRLKDEASQFFTHHSLRVTDVGRKFSDKKGVWEIIGTCQQKEIACRLTETGEIFGRASWDISKILYPELHSKWETIDKKRTPLKVAKEEVKEKEEEIFDQKELEEAMKEENELELDFSHEREEEADSEDGEETLQFSDEDEDEDNE